LDAAIWPVTHVDKSVIAENDAMRVTASSFAECARGAVLTNFTARSAPLPIVLVRFTSIAGCIDDHPMVSVPISDVDASGSVCDGVLIRIYGHVGGLVEQRVTGIERIGIAAG
jgi:hypothetical protein